MTTPTPPEFPEPRPSATGPIAEAVDAAYENFGPDHTATDTPRETPTRPELGLRRPKGRNGKNPLGGLGQNKKPRSGVRAINEKDREKIEDLYTAIGFAIMPFKPKVGMAFGENAANCADAWYTLAKKTTVSGEPCSGLSRVEHGGKLIAAHVPLMIAVMPEDALSRMPFPFGMPAVPDSPEGLDGERE